MLVKMMLLHYNVYIVFHEGLFFCEIFPVLGMIAERIRYEEKNKLYYGGGFYDRFFSRLRR